MRMVCTTTLMTTNASITPDAYMIKLQPRGFICNNKSNIRREGSFLSPVHNEPLFFVPYAEMRTQQSVEVSLALRRLSSWLLVCSMAANPTWLCRLHTLGLSRVSKSLLSMHTKKWIAKHTSHRKCGGIAWKGTETHLERGSVHLRPRICAN